LYTKPEVVVKEPEPVKEPESSGSFGLPIASQQPTYRQSSFVAPSTTVTMETVRTQIEIYWRFYRKYCN
jgi:hypothetical protein